MITGRITHGRVEFENGIIHSLIGDWDGIDLFNLMDVLVASKEKCEQYDIGNKSEW